MKESSKMPSTAPVPKEKPAIIFRALVALPVVESNNGALYQPERLVLNALYYIHHQKSPFTDGYLRSVVTKSLANLACPSSE